MSRAFLFDPNCTVGSGEPFFLFRCSFLQASNHGVQGAAQVQTQDLCSKSGLSPKISEGGGRHASNVFESGDV